MVKFHDCTFIAGSNNAEALPKISLPEIAFAGRSNVGKSSLINALVARKALARTSQTPGRTQQLNFFNIDQTFMLVDLPGYGYAKASKGKRYSWMGLTKDYLCGRPTLRRVFLLIDSRRDKPNADDIEWMDMFDDSAVTYQLVLTKCDKSKPSHLEMREEQLRELARKHPAAMPDPVLTSSEDNTGIKELRRALLDIAKR